MYVFFHKIKNAALLSSQVHSPKHMYSCPCASWVPTNTAGSLSCALSLYTVFSLPTSASALFTHFPPLGKTKSSRGSGWLGESQSWNPSAAWSHWGSLSSKSMSGPEEAYPRAQKETAVEQVSLPRRGSHSLLEKKEMEKGEKKLSLFIHTSWDFPCVWWWGCHLC